MMKFLKQLFCKHEWEEFTDADSIMRESYCKKCNKYKVMPL